MDHPGRFDSVLTGRILAVLAALALAGCSGETPRPRAPAARSVADPFAYPKNAPVETFGSSRTASRRVTVRLTLTDPAGATGPISTIMTRPMAAAPSPVVILIPGLDGRVGGLSYFSRYLSERGFTCLRLERPDRILDPAGGLENIREAFRREVVRVRRLLDWAETRPELDSDRIGVIGISTGAITAVLAGGVERRIGSVVLMLGGADLPRILLESEQDSVRWFRHALMAREDWNGHDLRRRARLALRDVEPFRFAGRIDPERTLLVEAMFDRVIPACSRQQLWVGCGRPARLLLPAGHHSATLFAPYVRWRTFRFLRDRLAKAPTAADHEFPPAAAAARQVTVP